MRYRNNKLKTLGPQAAHLVVTLYCEIEAIYFGQFCLSFYFSGIKHFLIFSG